MASGPVSNSRTFDIPTKCLLCDRGYLDPRVLPCSHAFCLKCLAELFAGRQTGNEAKCPECAHVFSVPPDGVGTHLPNLYVLKLFKVKEEDRAVGLRRNASEHETSGNDLTTRSTEQRCSAHVSNDLDLYCLECKKPVCVECYIAENHAEHRCQLIVNVAEKARKRLSNLSDHTAARIASCQKQCDWLSDDRKRLGEQISKAEREIRGKAAQMKRMIDRHEHDAFKQLKTFHGDRLQSIETVQDDIKRYSMEIEQVQSDVKRLASTATDCDVVQNAGRVVETVRKLWQCKTTETIRAELGRIDVKFTLSSAVPDNARVTIGHHTTIRRPLRGAKSTSTPLGLGSPKLTRVLTFDQNLYAVTSTGSHVFVVRGNNSQMVDVYDAKTFQINPPVRVAIGLEYPCGLAACALHNRLYISEHMTSLVQSVDLTPGSNNALTKWSVSRRPVSLSLTKEGHVPVVCSVANKLEEYTPNGSLLRETFLQAGIVCDPRHAVQVSVNRFVVIQPGDVHIVRSDGSVIRSFKDPTTSADHNKQQLTSPTALAVINKSGLVIVADSGGNRIVTLNPSLQQLDQQLQIPQISDGIRGARSLWLDESRGRLYVAEFEGSRLLVIDNILT